MSNKIVLEVGKLVQENTELKEENRELLRIVAHLIDRDMLSGPLRKLAQIAIKKHKS